MFSVVISEQVWNTKGDVASMCDHFTDMLSKVADKYNIDYEPLFIVEDEESGVYVLLNVYNVMDTVLKVYLSSSIQDNPSNF